MFGVSPKNEIANSDIFFHEDFSHKDLSEGLVGRKGLSLFKLQDMDVPVPPFFVIAPIVYKDFLYNAFDTRIEKFLDNGKLPEHRELEKLIIRTGFPSGFQEELLQSYSRLSGFLNTWVAVRSSLVLPDHPEVSFSGVFSTQLNVKGFENLVEAIKIVYASAFKDHVAQYCSANGVGLDSVRLAVVVQKMVQSEVAGTAFTVDPITQDKTKLSIEAVFGLGDVIADGDITPDLYLLNKRDLSIVEKHISPQEWMKVRVLDSGNKALRGEFVERIQISNTWSHQQKLEDRFIADVAKIALIVEEKEGKSQDMEWVWESGSVWVLQAKSIEVAAKSQILENLNKDFVLDSVYGASENKAPKTEAQVMDERLVSAAINIVNEVKREDEDIKAKAEVEAKVMEKAKARMEAEVIEQAKVEAQAKRKEEVQFKPTEERSKKEKNEKIQDGIVSSIRERLQTLVNPGKKMDMDYLMSGIGASNGVVAGNIVVIKSPVLSSLNVTKDSIILINDFSPEAEPYIYKAGGVILSQGGLTSDPAILCRELKIPAVVGASLATTLLKDGDIVKIDGTVGSIYKEKQESPKQVEQREVRTNKEEVDVKQENKKEEAFVFSNADNHSQASSPKIITATKVYRNSPDVSQSYNDGVVYLELDQLMLDQKRHLLAYVEDKNFKEYSDLICKKIDEVASSAGGNEVVISVGSASVGKFRELVKGSKFEPDSLGDSAMGASRYLANPKLLKKVLSLVKTVRNIYGNRNISLAINSPLDGTNMREVKKEISATGLRRTSTFKIYAVIDSPAEVLMCDDILASEIDGLIVNTPRIARQMQGVPVDDASAVYDIAAGSILKVIDSVMECVKKSKYKVIVLVEDNKALVRHCVKQGVYGVSVKNDALNQMRKVVSEEEMNSVFGKK